MKTFCAVLLLALAVSSADVKRCPIGERGILDGKVIFDNAVEGVCADASAQCAVFSYDMVSDGNTVQTEFGTCMTAADTYTCDDLVKYLEERGYGKVNNCVGKIGPDAIMSLTKTPECARHDHDLNIAPSCNFRQMLNKMADCGASYYNRYPYNDQAECSNEIDLAFKCYSNVVRECYSGLCPTIFDDEPGAREMMATLRDWSNGVDSLDKALANLVKTGLMNDTTNYKESIIEMACSAPGVVPAFVDMLPSLMNSSDWTAWLDESTLMLFNAIPCSDVYFKQINSAYMDFVRGFYSSIDKEEICSVFDGYKKSVSQIFLAECDLMKFNAEEMIKDLSPEFHEVAKAMMRGFQIWGEFFMSYNIPGCNRISSNYTTSCVTGERFYSDGVLLGDNTVDALCTSLDDLCTKFDYTIVTDGVEMRIVGGGCSRPEHIYGCDAIRNYTIQRGYGDLKSCQSSSCSGSYCTDLEATPATGCSLIKDGDIQILPGCTMKEAMYKFYACHEKFYENFPYENKDTCRKEQVVMSRCMSEMYSTCFSGRCPTVLDNIPGARALYPLIRDLTWNVSSVEELVQRMWYHELIDEASGKMIIEYTNAAACPDMKDLSEYVTEFFANFNTSMVAQFLISMDIDLVKLQAAMPCSMSYYTDFASAYQTMLGAMFTAGDRSKMCKAYENYVGSIEQTYKANCDESKFDDFLYVLMPDYLHEAVPYMVQACKYMTESFFENPTMPGCGQGGHGGNGGNGGNGGSVMINCDYLYQSNSKCAMKKAWLCDYAKWKSDFLGNWLQEYVGYQNDGLMMGGDITMDMMPKCYSMNDYRNFCRNAGKRECFTIPIINCPMCYCTDHEYNDLSGLLTYWRDDYKMWRNFFNVYKQNSGHSSNQGEDTC